MLSFEDDIITYTDLITLFALAVFIIIMQYNITDQSSFANELASSVDIPVHALD